jgi:hypothetical protein
MPYHLAGTAWSPRRVLRERTAHGLEGAIFAAAVLRVLGFPPLLLDLEAVQDTDHVIAVYRVRGGARTLPGGIRRATDGGVLRRRGRETRRRRSAAAEREGPARGDQSSTSAGWNRLTAVRLCGYRRASQTRSWPKELAVCPASGGRTIWDTWLVSHRASMVRSASGHGRTPRKLCVQRRSNPVRAATRASGRVCWFGGDAHSERRSPRT